MTRRSTSAFRLKALVLPALLLAVWSLISARSWVNPVLLPRPLTVLATAWSLLHTREYWEGLGQSLVRTLLGFAVAVVIGNAIGIALGMSRWADRIVGPTFHALRQIAPFAWIPLISAWFGGGESTKVAFITVASVSAVIFNTMDGVRSLNADHRELARSLEVGRGRYLRQVVLPAALPHIFTGLQLALVIAWLATVGAEYFLQIGPGVTYYLREGRSLCRMDMVLFGIVNVGVFGFLLTWLLTRVERRVLRWRPPQVQ